MFFVMIVSIFSISHDMNGKRVVFGSIKGGLDVVFQVLILLFVVIDSCRENIKEIEFVLRACLRLFVSSYC